MTDDASVTRDESKDDIFSHLRRQDVKIDAIRADIAFLVDINRNLKGLSELIKRWGGRLHRITVWIAKIGVPLIAFWQFVKDPVIEWFKNRGPH